MNTKHKILYTVIGALLFFVATWLIVETRGSDYYNYQGYVTEISQNDNGDTTVVTLCGDRESTFTLKWYTRVRYSDNKKQIAVGDSVKLTTTRHSDTNLKKIAVENGYSAEGKLVYIEQMEDIAFIISRAPFTNMPHLCTVVYRDGCLDEMNLGDTVKIYHTTPIYITESGTVFTDAAKRITPGTASSFSQEELALIESYGYTLKQD